jgi:hypothetical protein
MNSVNRSLIVLLILFISLTGCKKNSPGPDSGNPLLTVNFTDKFIPDQLSAIVFISDANGNLLADTTCRSNGQYLIYPENDRKVTSTIMVTVVNYEVVMHILEVHLNTYTKVTPYSEWTLKGTKPDSVGHSVVNLTNLPAITGPILYSNAGFHNLTFRSSNCIQLMYKTPDELYVRIRTAGVDKYKWQEGIVPGNTYTVDMSDAIAADHHTITFPFNVKDYEVVVSGYTGANFDSPLTHRTDEILSDGIAVNSIRVAFPPALFSGYISDLMLHETYQSDVQWFSHSLGNIPDQFRKIDATVTSVAVNGQQVVKVAAGTYKVWGANWQFYSSGEQSFDWNIYGPDTTSVLKLPVIAPAVSAFFTSICMDSLQYQYIQLDDYPNLSDYNEVLQKLFVTSSPKTASDFEKSSIRENVSGFFSR